MQERPEGSSTLCMIFAPEDKQLYLSVFDELKHKSELVSHELKSAHSPAYTMLSFNDSICQAHKAHLLRIKFLQSSDLDESLSLILEYGYREKLPKIGITKSPSLVPPPLLCSTTNSLSTSPWACSFTSLVLRRPNNISSNIFLLTS